jgi:hypothetical protein
MAKKTAVKKVAKRPAPKKKAAKAPPPKASPKVAALFAGLRKLLLPYAKYMVVKFDGPGIYYLETEPVKKFGSEVFFGAVQAKGNAVMFHLLPLDVFPELTKGMSPGLLKRMQDETSFRFAELDPALVKELAALTRQGYEGYRRSGLFAA